MPPITVGYDVSDAKRASDEFVAALKAQNAALGAFNVTMLQFNDTNEVTRATIEQVNQSGQKVTRTFGTLGGVITELNGKIKNNISENERLGNAAKQAGEKWLLSLNDISRLLERQLIRRAIAALVDAVRDGINQAIEFQVKLSQVANVTGQTGSAVNELTKQVRTLSEAYAIPNIQVLTAAQTALTSQIGDAAKGYQVLNEAARLTTATGIDLAASTKLITASLDAFNLSGDSAAKVANTLFLVSQRTRVPIDQLQSAIGRVGPIAQKLNIQLDEVAAAFLTMAQAGGRPTESLTLLNQVLGKLIEPSKAMQAVLNSWGTPTGEAAIATFGFVGVLQKLAEAAETTPGGIEELAGSIRALRGFLALTSDGAGKFSENLKALQSDSGELGKAVENTASQAGQRLKQEFEKIKNYFTIDLGQNIINTIVKIVDVFGGFEATINSASTAVKAGVAALVLYKVTVFATAGAQTVATAGIVGTTQALYAEIAAISAAEIAFAAFAVALGVIIEIQREEAERLRVINERVAADQENLRKTVEHNSKRYTEETEAYKKELNERLQAFRNFTAANVATAIEQKDAVVRHQKEIFDSYRTAIGSVLDSLRTAVGETRKKINESETESKNSLKRIQLFKAEADKALRSFGEQFESDPLRAINRLERERINLIKEASAEVASGDREREAAGQARFKEAVKIAEEIGRREIEIRKQTAAQAPSVTGADPLGQRQRYLDVTNEVLGVERRISQAVQAQAAAVEEGNKKRAEAKAIAEEEERKQKERLRDLEHANEELLKFRVFSETGKPKFVTKETGLIDEGAALAEFDRLSARLKQVAKESGADTIQAEKEIQALRLNFEQQIATQIREDKARQHQEDLDNTAKEIAAKQAAAAREKEAAKSGAAARIQDVKEVIENIRRFGTLDLFVVGGRIGPVKAAVGELEVALNKARTAADIFAQEQSEENKNKLLSAYDEIADALNKIQKVRGPTLFGEADISKLRAGGVGQTLGELTEAFLKDVNAASEFTEKQRQATIKIDEADTALDQLSKTLGGLPAILGATGNAGTIAGAKISESFADSNKKISALLDNTIQLRKELERTSTLIPGAGGPAVGRAFGGFIPSGTDTVPAMLTPGEFVINADSTRRFYSQLVAINAGMQPRYFAEGGAVTNIGDINVSVTGGSTSEKTVREIGRGLERELRRGTIKFSRR